MIQQDVVGDLRLDHEAQSRVGQQAADEEPVELHGRLARRRRAGAEGVVEEADDEAGAAPGQLTAQVGPSVREFAKKHSLRVILA